MLKPLRLGIWLLGVAWRSAPGNVLAAALVSLLVAAVPSVQVILMARFVEALADAARFADVLGPFIGLVLLIAISSPLEAVARTFRHLATDRVRMTLISEVADVVATISPSRIATPEVAAAIEKGNAAAQNQLPYKYPQTVSLISSVVAVVGVILTLWTMSAPAAVLVLASLVPILLLSQRVQRINSAMWDDIGPLLWRERYLHGHLVGAASARELSSLGGAGRIGALVKEANRRITARKSQTYLPVLGWSIGTGLGTSALLAAALAALVVGVSYGPEAAGGVYGVIAAMGVVAMFGTNLGLIVEGVAPYERFMALAGLREEESRPMVQPEVGELIVHDLRHTYPRRAEPALAGLDLTVRQGQIIALVGTNGAGKTTAVDAIVGNIELGHDSGSVHVDGRTRADLGRDGWAGYFGLLTQEFGRYELTVRQSLLLGTPRSDVPDEELWEALESAGAARLVRGFEHGLDQQLGNQWDGGTGLSGGQWQRLSLARIYVRNPPIWILDEPTSAIDAEAEQEIFRRLQATKDSRLTIVISHRAWTLRGMDEIIVLDEGHVVERGRFDELLSTGGRFAEIFAEQTA
ncbi:ABC transporter ATP-binding protein [Brachybacterium hainanense]|uniref:ABC transporter ATP-binding protein n=1 Tax=Brachybacterium hainanense TaxID=1541174 RepID=A0ABV6RAM8_9MICO